MVPLWKKGETVTSVRRLNERGPTPINRLLGVADAEATRRDGNNRAIPTSVRCYVVEISGDYLKVRRVRDHIAGITSSDFNAAKPFELRETPFTDGSFLIGDDGETYTASYTDGANRTVTKESDSSEEEQIIVPPYTLVQAAGATFNGSEIRVILEPDGTGVLDSNGVEIRYEDVNRGGRAWAKVSA